MPRKYKKREPSPIHTGDIVMMKDECLENNVPMQKNANRLMRVSKLKRAMSQNGWVVNVKVNEHPLYDLDGKKVMELEGYDVGWFIKYDTK